MLTERVMVSVLRISGCGSVDPEVDSPVASQAVALIVRNAAGNSNRLRTGMPPRLGHPAGCSAEILGGAIPWSVSKAGA